MKLYLFTTLLFFSVVVNAQVKKTTGPPIAIKKAKKRCLSGPGNSNCASLASSIQSRPGFNNQPAPIKAIALNIAKLADESNKSGISSPASVVLAKKINAQGPAIDAYIKSMNDREQKKLASRGIRTTNFVMLARGLLENLNQKTFNIFKQKNISPTNFTRSSGGGSAAEKNKAGSPVATAAKINGTAAVISPFENQPSVASNEAAEGGSNETKKSVEKGFKYGDNDVNKNSNESIFEQVSNRYLKSFWMKIKN